MRFLLPSALVATLFLVGGLAAAAFPLQEEQSTLPSTQEADEGSETVSAERDDDESGEAVQLFEDLKALVAQNDWESAQTKMTEEACDQFCTSLVITSVGLAETELPMEMPGFSESLDDIDDVVSEYELDRLAIDVGGAFEMEFSADPGDLDGFDLEDEELELSGDEVAPGDESESTGDAAEGDEEGGSEKILAHLDADGKRWEIVGGLWKALSGSPLALNELNGDILEKEADGETVYLTLELKPASTPEQDGIQIEIMSPPVVVKITRQDDGSWLYDGMDAERTQLAFEEFAESMPGMGPMDGGGRSDF